MARVVEFFEPHPMFRHEESVAGRLHLLLLCAGVGMGIGAKERQRANNGGTA